jgi:hypothetical protein
MAPFSGLRSGAWPTRPTWATSSSSNQRIATFTPGGSSPRGITEGLDNVIPGFIDGRLPSGSRQGGDDAPQDLEYTEGGKVLRTHLRTERDGKAALQAKTLARKRAKNGKLTCEACECVPEDDYRGLDLIEAHHRIPLSQGIRATKPEDFAMLCPCCHRAVHKLINIGEDPIYSLIHIKAYHK